MCAFYDNIDDYNESVGDVDNDDGDPH
jgi:hypothetical protein